MFNSATGCWKLLVGTTAHNVELSKRRAASVVAALTGPYGIDARRLASRGAGMSQPVAPNDTDEGDATECADAAIKSARRIEHVYRAAMSTLLEVDDLREVMGRREAYRRLARIGDHIHAAADRVWYAVMKEA